MAYSEDLRKEVIGYLEEGNTLETAKAVFKIGLTTIKRWKKQYKETGSLANKELHRSFRKLDPEKLSVYVKEHPDAYLREIAEVFGCTDDAVRLTLIKMKITRKKRPRCTKNATRESEKSSMQP